MDLGTSVQTQEDIDAQLKKLSPEEQKEFDRELFGNCKNEFGMIGDYDWCIGNGLKYSNPDIQKAKEILFKEKYARD
jgi:hypothetical protein